MSVPRSEHLPWTSGRQAVAALLLALLPRLAIAVSQDRTTSAPASAPVSAPASAPASAPFSAPAMEQTQPTSAPSTAIDGPTSAPELDPANTATTSVAHVPEDDLMRPRYVIEEIHLNGNDRTDRSVIMERVLVRPGEVLDEDRVELSRMRLLATGFFTQVNLRLERGSERGRVVLVIDLVERPPLPVVEGLFAGFSETTPIFGGLSVVDPNFLGRGLELGGGFLLAPDQQSYRLRLGGAHLFGSPIGARLLLQLLNGREPVALGDDPRGGGSIGYLRGGGYAGVSVMAGTYQRFMVDYHGELVNADPRLDPRVRRIPKIDPGLSYLSAVLLSYQRDSRDRGFVATSGSLVYVGVELSSTLLASAYEYSRYHLSYEQYIPTFADHSFSLRLDLGGIQPGVARGNTSGAPFFEAYYIGDYSFFRRNRNSLPRQLGLNVSAFSTYDDLLGSLTVSYAWPVYVGGDVFYRVYVYGSGNISEGTTARELQGLDPADDRFPVTFDAGLKLDTIAGSFVISASYLWDLVF